MTRADILPESTHIKIKRRAKDMETCFAVSLYATLAITKQL